MNDVLAYAQTHQAVFVDALQDFLRIPSISTDPAFAGDIRRAADWLVDHFRSLGVQRAESINTAGHPIVFAEHTHNDALPTVLVYGHYDVQPPDPLELWDTPPFVPTIRNNVLYARGACDDKGQLFMHLKALEAFLQTTGNPPVNVKYILEGEEENGSTHLPGFIQEHADRLKADIVVISDTSLFAPGVPSITYGLRGLAYVEVTLTGPSRDLHSGTYGGAIENPINVLARLIGGLHDAQHRITIDGFYNRVRPLTDHERTTMRALPFDEEGWAAEAGVHRTRTEAGYTTLEGTTARPALDCNGIWGGYMGSGAKTVLPSTASAKISMRLVPDQTPGEIAGKIRRYFERHTPPTMRLTFKKLHGGHGVLVDTNSPAMEAAKEALERVYGRRPYLTRIGGSIPIVADFKRLLGLDSILMGFGLDSDAIHSPNEHFGLDRFHEGIASIIHFMALYGNQIQ